MLRKILGVVALLPLPALLVAQRPSTPAAATAAVTHGIAMQVQGEVASPVEEMDGQNNAESVDEADGQNNDGHNDDGQFDQDGVDEPDGLNNDVHEGEQVEQAGEDQDDNAPPAPPAATGQLSRIGRHKP